MNSLITDYYPTFRMYQALRGQLLELLSDEDLRFSPGGENPPLGALCVEIGEVQHAYIQSFTDGRMDLSYRNREPGLAESVSQLAAWYRVLDAELEAVISHLSEEDIKCRPIDRGDWSTTPSIQLEVYKEALLIFYGKVSVYLKAMGKPRPQQWREWIA
jgi:uncharacterized damage-inducible protein DinB